MIEGNGHNWIHFAAMVQIVKDQIPVSWIGQIILATIIAAGGGGIGTLITIAVVQTKLDNLTGVIAEIKTKMERLEIADEKQLDRLRTLESRQSVDEALRTR